MRYDHLKSHEGVVVCRGEGLELDLRVGLGEIGEGAEFVTWGVEFVEYQDVAVLKEGRQGGQHK